MITPPASMAQSAPVSTAHRSALDRTQADASSWLIDPDVPSLDVWIAIGLDDGRCV
jgi:hypothetical protein